MPKYNLYIPTSKCAILVSALLFESSSSAVSASEKWTAVDRAQELGIFEVNESFSISIVDYDKDGRVDILIPYHDQGGKLWRNTEHGFEWPLSARDAWPRRSTQNKGIDRHNCDWGDFNGDGLLDAYCSVGRSSDNVLKGGIYPANELWLQNFDGSFSDVGSEWGVGDPYGRGRDVLVFDANGDGWSDIYVVNYSPRSGDVEGAIHGTPKLFLNIGGMGLVDSPEFGLDQFFGGISCAKKEDLNNDGWQDVVVCGDTIKIFLNNSGRGFIDSTEALGLSGKYFRDIEIVDLNGDGFKDVVGIFKGKVFYHIQKAGVFEASVKIRSLIEGREVAVGDADGDGDPDIYVLQGNEKTNPDYNNPDYILLNDKMSFSEVVDVPNAAGAGDTVEAVDVDSDGRVEFIVQNGVEVKGPTQLISLAKAENLPPVLQTMSDQSVLPGQTLEFTIKATYSGAFAPELTVQPIPPGASFTDMGDGTAVFTWTVSNSDVGSYRISFKAVDPANSELFDEQDITISVLDDSSKAPFQQAAEGDGAVTINAEHFNALGVSFDGYKWNEVSIIGSAGESVMQAPLEADSHYVTGYASEAARMDFAINFTRVGVHYVWIRGLAKDGLSDTVHVGLDGEASASGEKLRIAPKVGWNWSNSQLGTGKRIAIEVPNAGVHIVNIWLRESGAIVDRVLVTDSVQFMPTDIGPNENPRMQEIVVDPLDGIVEQPEGGDGTLVVDCTNFTGLGLSFDGYQWKEAVVGLSESVVAMQAPIEADSHYPTGYTVDAARMDYDVNFTHTGIHYIWVLGLATDGLSDTVHVGIDSEASTSGEKLRIVPKVGWNWSNSQLGTGRRITVDVKSVGVHTVNLWVRETGAFVHQILLTQSAELSP